MPEIQVKDKLITLEELGTAYNNITPANIGAVAKSGDTMTGPLIFANSSSWNGNVRIFADNEGGNIEIVSPNGKAYQFDAHDNSYLRLYSFNSNGSLKSVTFDGETGAVSATGGFNGNATNVSGVVAIDHGGTGATYGTIDITDYCTFPTGNVNTSSPYGGRLYYNPYLNCVFGTIVINDGASVNNTADIVYLKKDSSGTPLGGNNTRSAACGTCVHSATSPVAIPHIIGSTIKTAHTTSDPITSPRYTIMAFLG